MYKIPLTNSPNQTFSCTIPVNGRNMDFTITLNYNDQANYWVMTARNTSTQETYFTSLPLLYTFGRYANMLTQLDYKNIGSVYTVAIEENRESMPNDKNIGQDYILVWSDNE